MSQKTELQILTERAADGDLDAEWKLVEFFLPHALGLARHRIRGLSPAVSEAEDLANSAVKSLCLRIRDGRVIFEHDEQLKGLLRTMVRNKANKLWRYSTAEKRNLQGNVNLDDGQMSDQILSQQGIDPATIYFDDRLKLDSVDASTIANIVSSLQSELHDLFKALFDSLDEYPRQVLVLLMETNFSNEELASKIGRSLNSVERYRHTIRDAIKSLAN